ncbi:hypothetical protein CBM2592_A90177 [Cupriavidus taiwanensis]|nr:hypothetical protein CBM2588_A60085 [Cupriavidus taiwanensis]SOY56891.1 hypothetical protein CBM2592_A90177 [Cupriavidus taiwanensis]SOY90848.1 hypothetical protein CBM2591_A90177 [Cupriavidus taiwanensis]SOZ63652.1 hypothetical protein CBM2617_A70155 [Cupriavidus taiwanensis]SOZ82651.1 hypothetical protein CBM2618_A80156 [Cupriavidus taiwanensis]
MCHPQSLVASGIPGFGGGLRGALRALSGERRAGGAGMLEWHVAQPSGAHRRHVPTACHLLKPAA